MKFIVVPGRHGDVSDDAVLRGVAEGLSEFFPVPQHPHPILAWLRSAPDEHAGGQQAPGQDVVPREVLNEA